VGSEEILPYRQGPLRIVRLTRLLPERRKSARRLSPENPDQAHVVDVVTHIGELIEHASVAAVGLAVTAFVLVVVSGRLSRKIPGALLAVVAATRLSVTGHRLALYGWVRPAYRGLGLGHRLFGRAITELIEAYSGHNLTVDLGPDNAAWAGTSIRNVGWLRFYEQLGFTRDRSEPGRFQMTRVLL
jgi:GNAT superfamily N-acetyltransferase